MLKAPSFVIGVGTFVCASSAFYALFMAGFVSKPFLYESLLLLTPIGFQRRLATPLSIYIYLFLSALVILLYVFSLPFYLIIGQSVYLGLLVVSMLPFCAFLRYREVVHGAAVMFFAAVTLMFVDKTLMDDKAATSLIANKIRFAPPMEVKKRPSPVFMELASAEKPRVVLIVWESLGVFENPSYRAGLEHRFPGIMVKELRHQGGSTFEAEILYLCGASVTSSLDKLDCLPRRYNSSLAVHGNVGSYFSRDLVYREIGFSRSMFRRELHAESQCNYAYRAVCDAALISMISDLAVDGEFDLLYLLTIDSHFPYSKYDSHSEGLYFDLMDAITQLVLVKSRCDCDIFLVGDHPPPAAAGFIKDYVTFIKI